MRLVATNCVFITAFWYRRSLLKIERNGLLLYQLRSFTAWKEGKGRQKFGRMQIPENEYDDQYQAMRAPSLHAALHARHASKSL